MRHSPCIPRAVYLIFIVILPVSCIRDDEEERERDKDGVSEEDILSQVGLFQVPQLHKLYQYPSWAVVSRIWKKIYQTSSGLGTG